MGMTEIFKKAADIVFKVAGDLKVAITILSINDNGIDEPTTETINTYAIVEKNISESIQNLSFGKLFQPDNILIYIVARNLPPLDTNDKIIMNGIEYSIFGVDIDTANAVYTIGLG